LAANTKPHIFAFGHFTCYKMIWDSLGDHPVERDLFWDSLENNCGRTYFCGHEHFYDRASADDDGDPNNDLYQYVIGSAGAPEHYWDGTWIGDNSEMTLTSIYHTVLFGYVIVEIDGLDVTLTWMERQNNDPDVPGVYQPADVFSYTVCGDAAHPYPLGDLNMDCQVDNIDFAILGNQWGQSPGAPSADIAPEGIGDGEVNFLDLAVFVDHWLEGVIVSLPLPGRASNPDPPHNATGVSLSSDLSWTSGSAATSHDVYFGTDSDPPFVTNQTTTTFSPGTMAGDTTYFWRIDERNAWGKTTGNLWTFTTTTTPPP
jgi:hypothetical protein